MSVVRDGLSNADLSSFPCDSGVAFFLAVMVAAKAHAQIGPGRAVSFEVGSFIGVPAPHVPSGNSPYTIEAWIKPKLL